MPSTLGHAYLILTALFVAVLYRPVWLTTQIPPHVVIEAVHLWTVVFLAPLVLVSTLWRGLRRMHGIGRGALQGGQSSGRG